MTTLGELSDASDSAAGPQLVEPCKIDIGGVDPLGLRQINFDMMDQVLPGLNNVARHIRPYLLMAWAWRRAALLNRKGGGQNISVLRDFVDRIETIYAWSQFLVDSETDLPGSQALARLVQTDEYRFFGPDWEKFRDVRRYSTGLIAAVNYGPSLRSMEWLRDLSEIGSEVRQRGAYKANPQEDPLLDRALDDFEGCFADALSHEAFNKFGDVTVTREEAEEWGELWKLDEGTDEGAEAAWSRINSGFAGEVRKHGLELVRFAATYKTNGVNEEHVVRRVMANTKGVEHPSSLKPYAIAWRRMQVRQVFRLALEGLLHWTQLTLATSVLSTDQLAAEFIRQASEKADQATAATWLQTFTFSSDPIDHLDALEEALVERDGFAPAMIRALLFCMSEAPARAEGFERSDRLPILKAAQDWTSWQNLPPLRFVGNVVERWLLAQHTYWSVGRGLQDARGNGKTILRLRIFIDEGGWRLADGFNPGGPPNPTPDRVATALSLLEECGQLDA